VGKQAVADYFTAFCGLVAFWQLDYSARGDQLIAWGSESFTIERCRLEGVGIIPVSSLYSPWFDVVARRLT